MKRFVIFQTPPFLWIEIHSEVFFFAVKIFLEKRSRKKTLADQEPELNNRLFHDVNFLLLFAFVSVKKVSYAQARMTQSLTHRNGPLVIDFVPPVAVTLPLFVTLPVYIYTT